MMEMIIGEDVTIVNIDGLKFSREIFKYLASENNIGKLFKFVKVEDGLVTITDISEQIIYVAYMEDRHVDPKILLFLEKEKAIEYVRNFMKENMAYKEDIFEEDIDGYEVYISYGEETDRAFVVKCELTK